MAVLLDLEMANIPNLMEGNYEKKDSIWMKKELEKPSPTWTVHEKPGVAVMNPAIIPGTIQNKRWSFRKKQICRQGQMEFTFVADEFPYFPKESPINGITS